MMNMPPRQEIEDQLLGFHLILPKVYDTLEGVPDHLVGLCCHSSVDKTHCLDGLMVCWL